MAGRRALIFTVLSLFTLG